MTARGNVIEGTDDANFTDAARKSLAGFPDLLAEFEAWDRVPASAPPALLWALRVTAKDKALTSRMEVARAAALGLGAKPDTPLFNPYDRWDPKDGCLNITVMNEADALRTAAWRLSRTARDLALRALASSAAADNGELLRVATTLCEEAAGALPGTSLARLRDRYAALLVDEVQDPNPDQVALYRAFVAMKP